MLPDNVVKPIRLDRNFFEREDVLAISKALLGKFLVSKIGGQYSSGMIVETEAYRAPDDKACHAYNNRLTNRTRTMFGNPGHAYIYLCYGIHHLFNVVTAPKGIAHAILVRAIEPVDNIDLMLIRRGFNQLKPQLTAGPGVMTKALGITTLLDNTDMTSPESPIWLEDRKEIVTEDQIIASPRVGVAYAEECALWDWRFRIKNNPYSSRAK